MSPQSFTSDRRRFLNLVGGAALAAPILGASNPAFGSSASKAADHVAEFYGSLSEKQLTTICFPFEHKLRNRINANWHVTKPRIGEDFYTDAQRDLVKKILRSMSSEEGYKRLIQQMDDDYFGVEEYSMAVFGDPEAGEFQWMLTGRHLTLRVDGNSIKNSAFGGPIVYGHADEDPDTNLYHYQTKQTNKVFEALNPEQVKSALLKKAPRETDVLLQGANGKFQGLAVKDMASDQQTLVKESLQVLLAPYAEEDSKEVMDLIEQGGGLEKLHMAFYQQGDLKEDKVWDMWRVEGPSLVWNFRGAPHVHAYINIGMAKS
ncbi:MAG: DUF3500 domain-containing protein [Planctomycetota bacterium]